MIAGPHSSDKSSITIAIVGGGIGGLCSAIALGRLGYAVHLFEQAPRFSQIGAGVGFVPNSVKALYLLGLGEAYAQVADLSEMDAIWFRCRAWDTAEIVTDIRMKGRRGNVHRARMLEAFLPLIPSNVKTHFSTRVTRVENVYEEGAECPSHVRVSTTRPGSGSPDIEYFNATIVLGCDGIRSAVRESFKAELGGRISYSGTYAYRGLLDLEKAIAKVGEIVGEPTNWVGKDKHIVAFPVEHGKVLNVVAFVSDRSKPPEERVWDGPWVQPASRDEMFHDYAGWNDKVLALLDLIETPEKWAMFDLEPLERWTVGRVSLLGDSAHASLPHNGAGAGQAVEDAYVLSQLLAHQECTAETIPAFLQAYERVRRPRASKQQVHCRESGEICEFYGPAGGDYQKMHETLRGPRYYWLWEHDLGKDVEDAMTYLHAKGVVREM